jgi:hypothetical protein
MTQTVIVNEDHCVHSGKERYMPGDSFDCSDKEAKRLIGKGIVRLQTVDDSDQEAAPEDILKAAKAAIEAGKTTKDGRPTVEAIEEILGRDITAEERDEAWDKLHRA